MRLFYGLVGFLWGVIAGTGTAFMLYAAAAAVTWLLFAGKHLSVAEGHVALWILGSALAIAMGLEIATMMIGIRRGYRYGASLGKRATVVKMIQHLLPPLFVCFSISLLPLLLER
jgi:hypothetical protein